MRNNLKKVPRRPRNRWTEKIHGFLGPKDDKPKHFASIGRLITGFNGVEVIIAWILRCLVGSDDEIGRVLTGGMLVKC
jgi:hypothetical protein